MFIFHLDCNNKDDINFYNKFISSCDTNMKTFLFLEKINFEKVKTGLLYSEKTNILLYDKIDDINNAIQNMKCKFLFYSELFKDFWSNNLVYIKLKISNFYNKLDTDYSIVLNDDEKLNSNTVRKIDNKILININNFDENMYNELVRLIFKFTKSYGVIKDEKCILFKGNYNDTEPVFQIINKQKESKESNTVENKLSQIESYKEQSSAVRENKSDTKQVICYHTYRERDNILSKKNINTDMIRICLVGDWIESKELVKLWSRYCMKEVNWENIILVDEDDNDIDYYIVINRPKFKSRIIPSNKILFFHMEPNMQFTSWYQEFLNKFSSEDLLFNGKHLYHRNNIDWHLNKTYSELFKLEINKDKGNRLSMVLSNRRDNTGHLMRLCLAHALDKDETLELDIYGKCKDEKFRNYKYELPYYTRDEGIIPYKYHFMAENNCINNYFTEKIVDCILSETLCFYYGCPNLETYFNPACFIKLPLHNIPLSHLIIKKAIENNEWEKRIDMIRREKYKILNVYNLLPRVKSILKLNTNMITILHSNKEDEIITNFVDILKEQSFKNITTIKSTEEQITKDNLIKMCEMIKDKGYDCLILNHNNYDVEGRDNLIHQRVCDSLTTIRNINMHQQFLLLTKENNKNYLSMDMFIPLNIACDILDNKENKDKIEDLLLSVKLSVVKYVY